MITNIGLCWLQQKIAVPLEWYMCSKNMFDCVSISANILIPFVCILDFTVLL